MKAILSYENYFNHEKKYQLKFIHENETVSVSETLNTLIKQLKMKGLEQEELVQPYYVNESGEITHENTNIIGGINIPKNLLLEFINTVIQEFKIPVTIGNQEFTTFNQEDIQSSVNQLHINGTLHKGQYFNYGEMYYITFKYANEDQKSIVAHDFNCNLKDLTIDSYNMWNRSPSCYAAGSNYIFPFLVDKSGNLSLMNSATIGGTNIPEELLPFFINKFLKEYDMVITIGDEILKDKESSNKIRQVLITIATIEQGKNRKKTKQ